MSKLASSAVSQSEPIIFELSALIDNHEQRPQEELNITSSLGAYGL